MHLTLILVLLSVGCGSNQKTAASSQKEQTAANQTKDSPAIAQAACEANAEFVFIEGGEFIRGSDRAERDYAYQISAAGAADSLDEVEEIETKYRETGWFDREPERQTETLPAFCIGKNLITNADYQKFVNATGHPSPSITAEDYQAQGFLVHDYSFVEPYLWQDGQYAADQAQHPVVLISYEDALAYTQWRSKHDFGQDSAQDGMTYALPTTAQWEKAARGTDGRYFPWGDDWRAEATNWAKNGPYRTSAIATYPLSQSPYGVEDMAGNVFEYTSTLVEKDSGQEVLLKGCGWDDYPGFCRAAYQHDRPIDSKHILFGFRLVMLP